MKVSKDAESTGVTVTLETPAERQTLHSALVHAQRKGFGSRPTDQLLAALTMKASKHTDRTGISVTLETPAEILGLQAALVYARRKRFCSRVTDELIDVFATVACWGPGHYVWVRTAQRWRYWGVVRPRR